MTALQLTLIGAIAPLLLAGTGVSAKLYGDAYVWVPVSTYQKEKLYDLQDEAEFLEDKKELKGIDELEERELKRLLKQIRRLQQTL